MNGGAERDTIFALSSGSPPAAVAVVRISGPVAGATLQLLAGSLPPPRRASLRTLRDAAGEMLDRALVLWLPGPDSATGEDLAELHLHGGRAVVAAVERTLAALPGVVAAQPGAFTRRAFSNGRIDLAQAEGLADLLQAETEEQRRHALAVAEGGLSRDIEDLRTQLLDIAGRIEALIDFSDEEDVPMADSSLRSDVTALADHIGEMLQRPRLDRLRHGIRVIVAGPPNAGKSSLVNRMAGRDAALVSDVPGTTRDLIEVPLDIAGRPFLLSDSAGLREHGADAVEQMGIARSANAIQLADILLWLGEPADAPQIEGRIVRIHARADLPDRSHLPAGADIAISSFTGSGIVALMERLLHETNMLLPSSSRLGLSSWQRDLLDQVSDALIDAQQQNELILMAENMRSALIACDRLTGRANTEELLSSLFGRFCIGK